MFEPITFRLIVVMVLLSCSHFGQAQTIDPLAAQIEQCNQLEDSDPNAAIELAESLLTQIDQAINPSQFGEALGCMGWALAVSDATDAARSRAFQLEKLALDLPDSLQRVKLLRRAGSISHRMGDRISAAENYDAAMVVATSLGLAEEQIPLLVNLGVLNSEIREHEKAIDTYYQALDLMSTTEDFRYQPPVLFNLATTLNGQRRFAEGLKVFQQVETMINEHWPQSRVAQVYSGLAAANTGLQDYDVAKEYAQKAIDIYVETENLFNDYHNILSTMAAILTTEGDQEAALNMANRVKAYFTDPENQQARLASTNPLHSLALTYERLGQLDTAIQMHKLANRTDKDLQDTFNQQTMSQMQTRLEASLQREELATLKSDRINDQIRVQQAEFDRKILTVVAGGVLVVLVVSLWWQRRTTRKLTRMAMTDTLTQLGNRRAIRDWMAKKSLPAAPHTRLMWLIDLDDFKRINDEFDHDFGDYVLQQIANTLTGLVNSERFVGRWGGEEFMLITDDISDAEKNQFSDLLLQSIEATVIEFGQASTQMTASVGISPIVDLSTTAWNKAVFKADKALYTAKGRGKNCVVMATEH